MEAVGQEARQSQNPLPVPLNSTITYFIVPYSDDLNTRHRPSRLDVLFLQHPTCVYSFKKDGI